MLLAFVLAHSALAFFAVGSYVFQDSEHPTDVTGFQSLLYIVTVVLGWVIWGSGVDWMWYAVPTIVAIVVHHTFRRRTYQQPT